jgi:hypothetical protein
MSKVVRYQFMGSWLLFWLLFVSGIGIPFAILYLLNTTVRLDSELKDPEEFMEAYRAGKLAKGRAAVIQKT